MAKGATTTKQAHPVKVEVRKERGSRIRHPRGRQVARHRLQPGQRARVDPTCLPGPETVAVILSGSHILEVALEGKNEKMLIQKSLAR